MIKCPNCGFDLNGDETKCPNCGYVLKSGGEMAPPPQSNLDIPAPPADNSYNVGGRKKTIPFADTTISFFDGLFETIKLALFSPSEFFENYEFKTSIGNGILFALILSVISAVFSLIYNLIFRSSFTSMLARWGNIPAEQLQMQNAMGMFTGVMGLFLIPIGVLIGLFVMAGIYHLLLMAVNGAKNGFEATLNVVAYTSAVLVFSIIPFCGSTIAWIYRIVLNIMGLQRVHETTTGKASFAVLLPYLFCCLCFVIYIVFILGAVGLAAANSN